MIALPYGVCQDSQIASREPTGDVHGPHRDRGHAGLDLLGMHVHGHAIVLQHRHQRFGQLGVVPIGVDVHEVQNLVAGSATRPVEPSPMGQLQETAALESRRRYA
jgi:hypothetical protein